MDQSTRDRFELCLRLGDDRLVLGHRLSEWTGFAPILEEELALGNVALDLLGQASDLLGRAGELEGAGRDGDALAFFRDAAELRNCLLVEQPNGDFAVSMARQLFFDAWDLCITSALEPSSDEWLAGFARRAANEASYHWRHSRQWVIRLGDGTDESRRRMQQAIDELWPFTLELFATDALIDRLVADRVLVTPDRLVDAWRGRVIGTLAEAGLATPEAPAYPPSGGRDGRHGEGLGRMLSEMQGLARAFPGATW